MRWFHWPKLMETKFSVCGPPIGAQNRESTSIPRIHAAREVLKRWYAAVFPLLKSYHGTVVTSMSMQIQMWCPSPKSWAYGIPRMHHRQRSLTCWLGSGNQRFGPAQIRLRQIGRRPKIQPSVEPPLCCGWPHHRLWSCWVYHPLLLHLQTKRCYRQKGHHQGWGNVASAAGLYLSRAGAKIVGIIDRAGVLLRLRDWQKLQVEKLFLDKKQ